MRKNAVYSMILKDVIPFISVVLHISAYKNNKYLQKRTINKGSFFIYKKKIVNLCPILREVCKAISMLDLIRANK